MVNLLLQRLLQLLILLVFLSTVTFVLMKISPGDPVRYILGAEELAVTKSDQQELRQELGFDQPIMVQYGHWLARVLRLDFGRSYLTHKPVLDELFSRFPATLTLATGALSVMIMISVPLGILSAINHNRWIDHVSRCLALIGASIPSFWLGLIFMYLFSLKFQWFPTMGKGGGAHLVLPSLTLGVGLAAVYARLLRTGLIESLAQEYIRAARARGLGEWRILFRHALKAAFLPVITVFGVSVGHLIGGTVIVETLFSWPGMGKLMIDAIFQRDYPVIQGYIILTGIGVVMINLFVDLTYRFLDPKLSIERRR